VPSLDKACIDAGSNIFAIGQMVRRSSWAYGQKTFLTATILPKSKVSKKVIDFDATFLKRLVLF
jgi:hypothetical protein